MKLLETIIPILLISAAFFFILNRGPSKTSTNSKFLYVFNLIVISIGFYDGFFGPGTGSFFVLAFVIIKGISIMEATAVTNFLILHQILLLLSSLQYKGYVIWELRINNGCCSSWGCKYRVKICNIQW